MNADAQCLIHEVSVALSTGEKFMKIADIATVKVLVGHPDQSLAQAARTMCAESVGALIIVDPKDAKKRPIGILTDRDIVRGQLIKSADLHCLLVRDVMTANPFALAGSLELFEAIEALNSRAVRRAPMVDSAGSLVGVISLDDLVPAVADELQSLADLLDLRPSLRPGRRQGQAVA